MDSQPSEVVGRIASYVNPKDIIAMRLTNKNMKWKVDSNRRILPKPLVDVRITAREEFLIEVRLPAKGWTWKSVLAAPGEPEAEATEDERMGLLGDFYTSKRGIQKMTRGQFGWGMFEGLSLHLHFILNHMQIRTLSLHLPLGEGAAQYEYCDAIEQLMNAYGAGLEELRFHWDRYHLGLIETCKPTSLFLEPGDMFTDFYESLTVCKLPKLVMSPALTYDIELPVLSARILELDYWGHSLITIVGVEQFLKQWVGREREIEFVYFECGEGGICSAQEWRGMLANLDQNLVVVTASQNGLTTLRRISDGISIHARFLSSRIKLEAYYVMC